MSDGNAVATVGAGRLAIASWRQALWLVAIATSVTGLNALKPLTIDDAIYHEYAAHIAENPCDPYGFELYGVRPANHVLAPPGFLYWWGGAIRLFGEWPVLWKLSLFPLVLLLVTMLFHLTRRFASGLERPVVLMLSFSPALLPSWNLMLDLPALALGLAALEIFLCSVDRQSLPLVVFAGLVLAIAMQTKYTAFVMPLVMAWHAWLHGHRRIALTSVFVVVGLFAAAEAWLAHTYGDSQFLYHLANRSTSVIHKLRLALPLLSTLGGVAGWMIPLALLALGGSRRLVGFSLLLVMAAPVILAVVPEAYQVWWRNAEGESRLEMSGALFGLYGLVLSGLLIPAARRLLQGGGPAAIRSESRSCDWFLLGWIILEVLGYFALSPFPAVRRVVGLLVPLTLLVARLLAQAKVVEDRCLVPWAVALSVVLGLGFQAVDCWDAHVPSQAADETARWIRTRDPAARIWCIGDHAFPFHGERAGMKVLRPGSEVRPGDWLVWTDAWTKATGVPPTRETPLHSFTSEDCLPLRTQKDYYNSGRPMRHHEGPRCIVFVTRIGGP